jgi:hypothetical protein
VGAGTVVRILVGKGVNVVAEEGCVGVFSTTKDAVGVKSAPGLQAFNISIIKREDNRTRSLKAALKPFRGKPPDYSLFNI